MIEKKLLRFRRMALVTITATIFLIWVGGLVRSTGSGMGCPDWPKCFGQIIPPTDVSQLPADYKEHYSELRKEKNKRIASRLDKMGFNDVAHQIVNDPKVYVEEDFNATKTWIEYLNRLVGVLIGLFIFLTMIFSFSLRKYDQKIMLLSILGFILVCVEGFLGSIVVSTNLMPGMITVHMLLAMFLLVVLINAYQRTKTDWLKVEIPNQLKYIGIGVSIIVLFQILLGTQLREAIDIAKDSLGEEQRNTWLAFTGSTYLKHRYFYYLLVVGILFWAYRLKPFFSKEKQLKKWTFGILFFVTIEICLGLGMHYFAIPPVLQPMHLLFSTLIFGSVYYLTNILFRITK